MTIIPVLEAFIPASITIATFFTAQNIKGVYNPNPGVFGSPSTKLIKIGFAPISLLFGNKLMFINVVFVADWI